MRFEQKISSKQEDLVKQLQSENRKMMKKVCELESTLCRNEIEDRLKIIGKDKISSEDECYLHPPIKLRELAHRFLGIIAAPFVIVAVFLITDILVLSCPAPF